MASLKDLLPADDLQQIVVSSVEEGNIYRMHLGEEEKVKGKNLDDDGRNKYFIVLGHDIEGNSIGLVLIESQINPYLPQCRQDMHYPLLASRYSFLEGQSRYVDCSDFKIISQRRFSQMFSADKLKGRLTDQDLQLIRAAVSTYENASPKLLRRFGLQD